MIFVIHVAIILFVSSFLWYYLVPTKYKRIILRPIILILLQGPDPPNRSYDESIVKHENLQQIAPNLWTVEGEIPKPGPNFTRTMVVYRLPNTSSLLIHSPMCVNYKTLDEIEKLGHVKHIIIPNRYHRMDAAAFSNHYPNAKVYCPMHSYNKISPIVKITATCEETFRRLGFDNSKDKCSVRYIVPKGTGECIGELAYLLEIEGAPFKKSALIVCDLFFNLHPSKTDSISKFMGLGNGFGTSSIGKFLLPDANQFECWIKDSLLRLAEEESIEFIIVAHGDLVLGKENVKRALLCAASNLPNS